jgi:putative sigma-54 modulation protein
MMEYHAKEKSLKFTNPMKEHVEKEIKVLGKYLNNLDGRTTVKKEGTLLILEIEVAGVRASGVGEDFYDLTKIVVSKIQRQINKSKSVRKDKPSRNKNIKEFVSDIVVDDDEDSFITREKTLITTSMTESEAVEEIELLGHDFFIYKDIDRGSQICVLYKRRDGFYGVIVVK